MGKALDHAKTVVRDLGLSHQEFAQGDIITHFPAEHQQGVCSGLSLMYQAYHNGIFNDGFFARLTPQAFHTPSVVNYISLAQNWQFKEGLSADAQHKAMIKIMAMFGFKFVDEAEFDEDEPDYTRFTDFIGGRGYHSMVHIPGHAMAAVGRTIGLKFFDPNIGEVSAKTNRTMAKFFERFFSGQDLRPFYLRNSRTNRNSVGQRATLRVERFRLHG